VAGITAWEGGVAACLGAAGVGIGASVADCAGADRGWLGEGDADASVFGGAAVGTGAGVGAAGA